MSHPSAGHDLAIVSLVCEPSGRRNVCKKAAVADGKVTEILDEHYSVVTFPAGTTFEEGNTIEKS